MTVSSTPPNDRQRLTRALIIGAVLSVLGIILFVVLYVALGSAESAPRLFISLCVPPLIIALILGIYVLVARSRST